VYVPPSSPLGVPSAIPIPIDWYDVLRMFARWPGLFIHALAIARGVESRPEPYAMFSPTLQARAPSR